MPVDGKPPKDALIVVEVVGWSELQHFKDRDPIWIKLYRRLRHKRNWRQMSGDGAKLLIDLWLLAAEQDDPGIINLTLEDIGFEVRIDDKKHLGTLLKEVRDQGFIKLSSGRYQVDISHALPREETEKRREETETEDAPDGAAIALVGFCARLGVKWDLTTDASEWIRKLGAQFAELDMPSELELCAEYWEGEKAIKRRKMKAPSRAIRNWMKNARKFNHRDSEATEKDTGDFNPDGITSV